MARKFLQDIKAQVSSTLPDNTTGLITPANHRLLLDDLIDSVVDDEAALTNIAQTPLTVTVQDTWTILNDALAAGIYDTIIGGDNDFLTPDLVDGAIITSSTAGFTYEALGAVQVDAATNIVVECALGLDGVPGDLIGSIVGTAGARLQGIYVTRYINSVPASSKFQLMLRAPAGPTSVDLVVRTFGVIIKPTRDPA